MNISPKQIALVLVTAALVSPPITAQAQTASHPKTTPGELRYKGAPAEEVGGKQRE